MQLFVNKSRISAPVTINSITAAPETLITFLALSNVLKNRL